MSGDVVWVVVVVALLPVGLLAYFMARMPEWAAPELFFAVTVPADFRGGAEARAILAGYRWGVAAATLVAAAVALLPLAGAPIWLAYTAVALQMVGALWAFLSARKRVLPASVSPSAVRAASVRRTSEPLSGGWLGQLGPFLILAAVATYLLSRWADVPDRFPIHWNLAGEPDGWADKSLATALAPLLIAAVICALLGFVGYAISRLTRRRHPGGEAAELEGARRRTVVLVLLAAGYVVALSLAPAGFLPLIRDPRTERWVVLATLAGGLAAPLVLTVWIVVRAGRLYRADRRRAEAAPAAAAPLGDGTRDAAWKGGLIYVDRDDPALFVEKRLGIGYTLNFGRPAAWVLLAALLIAPLALALVAIVLAAG